MYKVLAALPEISATDPLVYECPAIKNPTNRKPLSGSVSASKSSMNIKSKILKDIVLTQINAYKKLKNSFSNEGVIDSIVKMETIIKGEELENSDKKEYSSQENLSKAYSLAIFTKALYKMLSEVLFSRYNLLFSTFRMPLCYTSLKEMLNTDAKIINDKYSLCYKDFCLEKINASLEANNNEIELLSPVVLPKKRKHTLKEMSFQLKKIFINLERKPGLMTNEALIKQGKGIDTNVITMLKYLQDIGYTSQRDQKWELKYKSNNGFIYFILKNYIFARKNSAGL